MQADSINLPGDLTCNLLIFRKIGGHWPSDKLEDNSSKRGLFLGNQGMNLFLRHLSEKSLRAFADLYKISSGVLCCEFRLYLRD